MICSHFDQWFVNPPTRKLITFRQQSAVLATEIGVRGYRQVTVVVSFIYVHELISQKGNCKCPISWIIQIDNNVYSQTLLI